MLAAAFGASRPPVPTSYSRIRPPLQSETYALAPSGLTTTRHGDVPDPVGTAAGVFGDRRPSGAMSNCATSPVVPSAAYRLVPSGLTATASVPAPGVVTDAGDFGVSVASALIVYWRIVPVEPLPLGTYRLRPSREI